MIKMAIISTLVLVFIIASTKRVKGFRLKEICELYERESTSEFSDFYNELITVIMKFMTMFFFFYSIYKQNDEADLVVYIFIIVPG